MDTEIESSTDVIYDLKGEYSKGTVEFVEHNFSIIVLRARIEKILDKYQARDASIFEEKWLKKIFKRLKITWNVSALGREDLISILKDCKIDRSEICTAIKKVMKVKKR